MISLEKWNAKIDAFIREENAQTGRVMPVHRIYCQDDSDRSGGGIYNETVTVDTIGRFARALGDSNPLYSDPRYVRAAADIIAPPLLECCICSTFIGGRMPRLRGISVFDAGTRWERFVQIHPGDSFSAQTTYLGIREVTKTGSADRLLVRSHAVDLTNQRGEHVSRLTARSMIRCAAPEPERSRLSRPASAGFEPADHSPALPESSEPGTHHGYGKSGSGGGAPDEVLSSGRPHYTQDQLDRVYANLDAQFDGAFRRGSTPRYWEDVQAGDRLPDQIIGPYDESDGQALMAAIGVSNAFATKWGTIRRVVRSGRGRGVTDPETGAFRLPIDRHNSDVIARAQGLPRALVSGIHSQALLAKSVSDWMGDAGFLRVLDCKCRKTLYYGDLSTQRGCVTRKYEKGGKHFAVLKMEALRQDGIVHTEAEAVVELPSRC